MSAFDFKTIKEKVSLFGFFENDMGADKVQIAGQIRYSICPNPDCGESSKRTGKVSVREGKWHCFACGEHGDVIEAANLWKGYGSLSRAADYLSGNVGDEPIVSRPVIAYEPVPVRNQEAINKVIERLFDVAARPVDGVVSYLEGRGITRELTLEAIDRGIMLHLPTDPTDALRFLLDEVGKDLLCEAGMWKEGSKTPGIIYKPLLFVSWDKSGVEFRIADKPKDGAPKAIRYGNPTPCIWEGNGHAMITEGFIDMLSAVALGSERTIYGIPGAENWSESDDWINSLAGKNTIICLDDDSAGKRGRIKLHSFLSSIHCRTSIYTPPDGLNDLNDQLKSLM